TVDPLLQRGDGFVGGRPLMALSAVVLFLFCLQLLQEVAELKLLLLQLVVTLLVGVRLVDERLVERLDDVPLGARIALLVVEAVEDVLEVPAARKGLRDRRAVSLDRGNADLRVLTIAPIVLDRLRRAPRAGVTAHVEALESTVLIPIEGKRVQENMDLNEAVCVGVEDELYGSVAQLVGHECFSGSGVGMQIEKARSNRFRAELVADGCYWLCASGGAHLRDSFGVSAGGQAFQVDDLHRRER